MRMETAFHRHQSGHDTNKSSNFAEHGPGAVTLPQTSQK
jgi:hypothetical protein